MEKHQEISQESNKKQGLLFFLQMNTRKHYLWLLCSFNTAKRLRASDVVKDECLVHLKVFPSPLLKLGSLDEGEPPWCNGVLWALCKPMTKNRLKRKGSSYWSLPCPLVCCHRGKEICFGI